MKIDIKRLESEGKIMYHHTAVSAGYVSRKCKSGSSYPVKPYKGRFGEGYKRFRPRYDTNRYCYVEYWILVKE